MIQPLQTLLDEQHRNPRGLLGRYVGEQMARQHYPETLWTLQLLQLAPSDQVLEIGCGAGKALALAAKQLSTGKLTGIDTSTTMVALSRHNNAPLLKAGQLSVVHADVVQLPFPDRYFDKLWSIHTLYFWSDYTRAIAEIKRVMKPGGTLALTFSPGTVDTREESSIQKDVATVIIPAMRRIGFTDVALKEGPNSRQYRSQTIIACIPSRAEGSD